MSKFTFEEKTLIESIVGTLTIKRMSENEIIKSIFDQTNKIITRMALYNIRQKIKRDSYQWYKMMREGQYVYP